MTADQTMTFDEAMFVAKTIQRHYPEWTVVSIRRSGEHYVIDAWYRSTQKMFTFTHPDHFDEIVN